MTITSQGIICPVCGGSFRKGGYSRHRGACGRDRTAFELQAGTPADLRRIERAGAHGVHAELLEPEFRLGRGVSDLDVARLMLALESGVQVIQGGRGGWTTRGSGALARKAGLPVVVDEAIRLGLVRAVSELVGPSVHRVYVVPAPVHLRSPWDNLAPACPRLPGRYRLVKNRLWVDCKACSHAY